MFNKGDFHMHSKVSDGCLSPGEIVVLAKERGLDIIALTDHNTTLGNYEAISVGKIHEVKVIPGIELSTRYKGNRVHILGYFRGEEYESDLFKKSLKYLVSGNVKKTMELLNHEISLISEGGKPTVQSGIRFLKYFNCVVVLAHPVSLKREIFKSVIEYDFDGIEAKYFRNNDDDTEYFIKTARSRNIIYTAGSDFHTNKKLDLKHGTLGQIYLEGDEIEKFISLF